MPDINLLTTKTGNQTSYRRIIQSVIVRVLVVVLVLILVYFGFLLVSFQVTNQALAGQQDVINKNRQAIDKNSGRNELVTHQGQLKDLTTLTQKHLYWSQLFPELARVALKTSIINELTAKDDGTVQLNVSVPDYAELDKFMQVFDQDQYNTYFSSLKLKSLSKTQNNNQVQVSAILESKFSLDLLKKKPWRR